MQKRIPIICFTLAMLLSLCGCQKSETPVQSGVAAQTALRSVLSLSCNFENGGKETQNSGSGVVLQSNENGAYIATSLHIFSDFLQTDEDFSIALSPYGADGNTFAQAEVAGILKDFDLAVLYTQTLKDAFPLLQAVSSVSENIAAGEDIFVIGNALGKGLSATRGVVSVPSEYVTMSVPYQLDDITLRQIRADAPMNQGCSGGGAFDSKGNFIGMVNARSNQSGVNDFGYIIPSGTVMPLAHKLIQAHKAQKDSVSLFDFGAVIREENAKYEWSAQSEISLSYDLRVSSLKAGSVSSVFLQNGDTLTAIQRNGKTARLTKKYQVEGLFYEVETGDTLIFSYQRESTSKNYTLSVTDAYMKTIKII